MSSGGRSCSLSSCHVGATDTIKNLNLIFLIQQLSAKRWNSIIKERGSWQFCQEKKLIPPRQLVMCPMNEPGGDLVSRYIPTRLEGDLRRIAHVRVVMGLCPQTAFMMFPMQVSLGKLSKCDLLYQNPAWKNAGRMDKLTEDQRTDGRSTNWGMIWFQ